MESCTKQTVRGYHNQTNSLVQSGLRQCACLAKSSGVDSTGEGYLSWKENAGVGEKLQHLRGGGRGLQHLLKKRSGGSPLVKSSCNLASSKAFVLHLLAFQNIKFYMTFLLKIVWSWPKVFTFFTGTLQLKGIF